MIIAKDCSCGWNKINLIWQCCIIRWTHTDCVCRLHHRSAANIRWWQPQQMLEERCFADLRGSDGQGLDNVERDGGVVSYGIVVQSGAIRLCETYSARYMPQIKTR